MLFENSLSMIIFQFDSSSIDDVVLNLKSRTQFSCAGKKYQAITKKLKKNQVKVRDCYALLFACFFVCQIVGFIVR